jgi:hypothetical protein
VFLNGLPLSPEVVALTPIFEGYMPPKKTPKSGAKQQHLSSQFLHKFNKTIIELLVISTH